MSVKQTWNLWPPPSNFEQTMNKQSWRDGTRVVHKCSLDERAAFCAQHNKTEEELLVIEYGEDWWKQPLLVALLHCNVKLGKIWWSQNKSWCYPREWDSCILGTRHKKGVMFGVRYLDEGLRKGENIVWVKFKYLYHFYQKATLEVSIMSLWTM